MEPGAPSIFDHPGIVFIAVMQLRRNIASDLKSSRRCDWRAEAAYT
jgi:hypothetical protein